MSNLASVLQDRGRGGEAEALYREAEETLRKAYDPDDTMGLRTRNDLATLLVAQDKLAESETIFLGVLVADRRIYGADHPETLTTINNLGVVLSIEGKLDEAEPLYREAADGRRRVLGPEHADTLLSLGGLAKALRNEGRLPEATQARRDILAALTKARPAGDPQIGGAMGRLGDYLAAQGAGSEAESMLVGGFEILDRAPGTPPAARREAIERIIRYYEGTGRPALAGPWRARLGALAPG